MTQDAAHATGDAMGNAAEGAAQRAAAQDAGVVNVAILGAGRIAHTMAKTLAMMAGDERYATLVAPYAVASRSQDKADAFAEQYGIAHAYGSYEAMLADPAVDLVYIATPHPLHAQQAIDCMRAGKNVLVEKPFAANLKQAQAALDVADDTGLLCAEAFWTRYMPSRLIIDRLASGGEIGDVTSISADLSYRVDYKERLTDPNLAGGALLDVGVYPLNFIDMLMGAREISRMATIMAPYSTGVDASNATTLVYADNTLATATSSMTCASDKQGIVRGTGGYFIVNDINNPAGIDVFDADHQPVRHIDVPAQLTGYEYEVAAAANAVRAGRRECVEMTHADTLRMMALYDAIRKQWNLQYPFER